MIDDTDALGRPLIDGPLHQAIASAFAEIPDSKRGALLLVADQSGARLQVAAKINDSWKIAAGAGVNVDKDVTFGVVVQGSW